MCYVVYLAHISLVLNKLIDFAVPMFLNGV